MTDQKKESLKKELRLFDVYAISTGAMFSSGFFLLPGLAAAKTGPSVILAYLVAGLFILPTMLSVAELSTAMPKSGGAYYFIDRSLGPLFGTIGGFGSWLALIFKSAFALIGMGAYAAIFIDVPILPVALVLTVVFALLNIFGAKETSWLQKALVAILVTILLFYVIQGLFAVFKTDFLHVFSEEFTPFFQHGPQGFFATIGLVFVSYAGLTKVASVSEEVQNPDKNIPLGMMLSLATATFIYVVGVFIMVMLLDSEALQSDLTPVATAGEVFLNWLPGNTGLVLVVIAAIAAFASTANAGIMSAARYPFAMARDRLIPDRFGKLGRFGTPAISTIATTLTMILLLLIFKVESVAKLASAFQLLLFAILNVCVIVMRESRIEGYAPGFKSPFYPWVQLAGFFISAYLIAEMGLLSIIFTLTVSAIAVVWYFKYAKERVVREGAIYHVHARLGKYRYEGLDREMREIVREKGMRKEDPYKKTISQAVVLDLSEPESFNRIEEMVVERFAERIGVPTEKLLGQFLEEPWEKTLPIRNDAALKHFKIEEDIDTLAALVRIRSGMELGEDVMERSGPDTKGARFYCLIFIISSKKKPGQHLRILAHLAEMVDSSDFHARWMGAKNQSELKEVLMRDELFINIELSADDVTRDLIDKKIKDLELPGESLITLIKREGRIIFPHGQTTLKENDELTIIGEKEDIDQIRDMFYIEH